MVAHLSCDHTVPDSGGAAPLNMAQYSGPGLDAGQLLYGPGDIIGLADALSHNYQEMALAALHDLLHPAADLIKVIVLLRSDNGLCANS